MMSEERQNIDEGGEDRLRFEISSPNNLRAIT